MVALLAGSVSGVFLAVIQHYTIVPMILEAETYEVAGNHGGHVHTAEASAEMAWAPDDGYERTFFTSINIVFIGIGFGLLLTASYALCRSITWRSGLLWGAAGFAAFHLAPAIGLPPELPGDAAAGVGVRQVWWLLTVGATVVGLWVVVFRPLSYQKILGLALIVLPHVFGAPQPEVHGGMAPEELRSAFIITSLVTNAIFWIVLGMFSAYLFNRMGDSSRLEGVPGGS